MTRLSLTLATLLAVCSSSVWAQRGPPPAKVLLDEVRMEVLTEQRAATGEIRSPMRSQLAVQVAGLVTELFVKEGEDVKQGQVIARLDDARAQLQVRREKAQYAHAQAVVVQRQAELDEAQRDFERVEELQRRGSAGMTEIDGARTLLASRTAQLSQAQAELMTVGADYDLAQRELEDTVIRAPFAGRVVERHTEVGQWIDRGGAVATVVSLTDLEARVDIPQQYYQALNDSTGPIEILVPAINATVSGEMIAIIPQADSLSRLFPARIRIHDPKQLLRPGMSVTAMIPTGVSSEMLTVSKDAIVRTATGEHLFFNADGVAAMMTVHRLFAAGDRVAIRPGKLVAGMTVVVDGNERLRAGQALTILDEVESAIGRGSAQSGEDE